MKCFGFECIAEASDGNEAVEAALRVKPDVILMDLVLPNKNGIQAAKDILETDPGARIIAISTMESEEIQAQALEAGCLDFVAKPFDHSTLKKAIDSLFEQRGALGG